MTVEAYGSFTDPGATAFDEDLGALPVTVTGSVDVITPGVYVLSYTASNGFLTTTVTRTVTVVDSTAPAISDFAVRPDLLWPPRHQMIEIAVDYTATDASGVVDCTLEVESNEPADGFGDGDTEVDWEVLSAVRALIRAERSGTGHGRIYSLTVTCADNAENSAQAKGIVTVPLRR